MNTRQRTSRALVTLTVAALAFGLILTRGCNEHGHDDAHGGEHGDHAEGAPFVEPQSYAGAVKVIHDQLEKIEELIDTRKLDRVHAEAAVIRDVANMLGKLAVKDSGVPQGAVREINLTAKDLAAKFGPIDEAGDSGDLAGTEKVYREMVALFETVEKYVDPEAAHGDHDH